MLETAPTGKVEQFLSKFGKALESGDIDAAVAMFADECYWRDLVTFTWNIKTMEGKDAIRDMLTSQLDLTQPRNWHVAEGEAASEADGVTEAWITFETDVARGYGLIRLKGDSIWTLLTSMVELKGHEEKAGFTRPLGARHGDHLGERTWKEVREEETAKLGSEIQPYCVIIGGGQGGIALGARLRQLGVPTIIVERNEKPGDSWRKRYKSLALHDPVWYDHLPYIDFPKNWPVFSPKDKIGDWLEAYVSIMELDYWTRSEAQSARYDEQAGAWVIDVLRDGRTVTLRPQHLVLATGVSGMPNVPDFPGAADFRGEQHHSSRHVGGEGYRGKRAIVIGSNNSAHDIAAALWEHGAEVTMVQRSSTHVSRSDTLTELGTGPLYSEEALARGITTEMADMISASVPYRLLADFQKPVYAEIRRRDADFYARLEASGFMLDFGEDESGLFMKYLRRGSGYYIDVGASALIADGSIRLKPGVAVKEIRADSVVFSDGSELPADLIVYATGYGSMNQWAARLISQAVADKVGKCWGLGSGTAKDPGPFEGELRNMWKPTAQEGLWFHGGNLHQSRHYSLYLALQLKARMERVAGTVYGMQKVHHST